MKKATLQLETLSCPSCLQKIENAITLLDGVEKESIKILFNASKVRLTYNETLLSIEEIERAIEKLGYVVKNSKVRDVDR